MTRLCPYCNEPLTGAREFCSSICKERFETLQAKLETAANPEMNAKQIKAPTHKNEPVPNFGVTTCGHIVNGHSACHSKIPTSAVSPFCSKHEVRR